MGGLQRQRPISRSVSCIVDETLKVAMLIDVGNRCSMCRWLFSRTRRLTYSRSPMKVVRHGRILLDLDEFRDRVCDVKCSVSTIRLGYLHLSLHGTSARRRAM